jgi:uncharacterized membrane-anchored protein
MKSVRLIIFLVVALAQISVPASMIWKRQRTLHEGRVWKFRTAPADPVDVVRGRYLALRFSAENFPRAEPVPFGDDLLYVTLKEDAEGFAIVDDISYEPRSGDNVVRADNYGHYEGEMRIRFPFDSYWVNEVDAPAADKAYAEHSRREQLDAYVTVRVRDGDAVIEELYIADQPLRDFLRAHR